MKLVTEIYKVTAKSPNEEKFGLASQMRRAVVSIPSNIAERAARNSRKEFINFLHIAQGSAAELETQLFIAGELNFIESAQKERSLKEVDEISKMIIGLQHSLRTPK